MKPLISSLILLFMISGTAFAQHEHHDDKKMHAAGDEKIVQVLENFRMAIINNDQQKASALLADDARILESGGIETKVEYLSHHFQADGKFLRAMKREITSQQVQTKKQVAWISTTSTMTGTYKKRMIKMSSAELAVLVKTDDGCKISALHWSSRNME